MNRGARGNMLVLSGVFVSVNALAVIIASSFGSLYFVHNRLQTTADELALQGTSMLNADDRIGQMNNMIARSRQMVTDSNSSLTQAHSNLPHLAELTDQMHQEARDGAVLLEQERVMLTSACMQDAQASVAAKFAVLKQGHSFTLPWLQVGEPSMVISFGRMKAVQSNVAELPGIQALDSSDKAQYISNDGSKLYKNNINAKLNDSDTDLNFKITSLPAPVQTTVSPARAALAANFVGATDDQASSACQVTLQLNVATGMGASTSSEMQAVGTAETNGGEPVM